MGLFLTTAEKGFLHEVRAAICELTISCAGPPEVFFAGDRKGVQLRERSDYLYNSESGAGLGFGRLVGRMDWRELPDNCDFAHFRLWDGDPWWMMSYRKRLERFVDMVEEFIEMNL